MANAFTMKAWSPYVVGIGIGLLLKDRANSTWLLREHLRVCRCRAIQRNALG
jgi:hypothetical protein